MLPDMSSELWRTTTQWEAVPPYRCRPLQPTSRRRQIRRLRLSARPFIRYDKIVFINILSAIIIVAADEPAIGTLFH
jgi:hypothetical protein